MDGSLLKRVDKLTLAATVLAGMNNETAEWCNNVSQICNELKVEMSVMRNVIEKDKSLIDEMKKLEEKLNYYDNYIDYIEDNFPDLPEQMQSLYIEDFAKQNCASSAKNGREPQKVEVHQEPVAGSFSQNNANKKPLARVTTVRHITVQELNSVHSYMRGRLTADSINLFVDVMNSVLNKKYEILKKPRNKLKNTDFDLYDHWKTTERKASLGSGSYFCTAEDFVKLENYKLDKRAFSKMVVIRHLKLIKEARCGKEILYVVL